MHVMGIRLERIAPPLLPTEILTIDLVPQAKALLLLFPAQRRQHLEVLAETGAGIERVGQTAHRRSPPPQTDTCLVRGNNRRAASRRTAVRRRLSP